MCTTLEQQVKELKSKLGGYQTSNENYRKRVTVLAEELNSVRESLRKELQRNEDFDKKNSDAINQFYREKEQMRAELVRLGNEKYELEKELEGVKNELEKYKSLPWYKKIFIH